MIKFELTEREQVLIKKVCELQLDSFRRILSGQQETEIRERLIEQQLTEEELNDMISGVVRQYRDIYLSPRTLFKAHVDLLGNFREALDYNADTLSDFSGIIPQLLRRLDLAIFILDHRN